MSPIFAGTDGANIPDPSMVAQSQMGGAVSSAGPTLNKTAQTFLGIMGAEGFPAPVTPNGPFATAYLGREAQKVENYRAATQRAFNQMPNGQFYVFTGVSNKAATSFQSMDSLMSEFEAMPNKEKKELAKLLAMAGYLTGGESDSLEDTVEEASLMEVADAYTDLLSSASARLAQGQNITPDDLLEMNIRYNMSRAGLDADAPFSRKTASKWYDKAIGKTTGKPHKETQVNTSVDLFSPEDARGLARATLQQALGRDPSEAEYEDFIAALQAKARANPSVSRTTTQFDAEGNVTAVRTVNSGGLTEAGINNFAQEQAEAAPDWAEWQAVGTYFPGVMDALGSVVPNA